MTSTGDVGVLIAAYRPRSLPEGAGVFARSVVAAAVPSSVGRAKALLWAAARLAAFGLSVGLEPDPAVLLRTSVIERFVIVGVAGLSPASRRTLRANLEWLAATTTRRGPRPLCLPRDRAKKPYSQREIAAWLGLADAQGSQERRMRAQALVCLGAGAGICGSDLPAVTGVDPSARAAASTITIGMTDRKGSDLIGGWQ